MWVGMDIADFEVGDVVGEAVIVGEDGPDDVDGGANEVAGVDATLVASGGFDDDAGFCGGVFVRLDFAVGVVGAEEGEGGCAFGSKRDGWW